MTRVLCTRGQKGSRESRTSEVQAWYVSAILIHSRIFNRIKKYCQQKPVGERNRNVTGPLALKLVPEGKQGKMTS